MLLGIGTKVKFLHAPEEGVITDKLGDGMVMVLLKGSNMEIPAAESDLIRADALRPQEQLVQLWGQKTVTKSQSVQDKQWFAAAIPKHLAPKEGIQLAFVVCMDKFGEARHYDAFLLNGTKTNIYFSLKINLLNKIVLSKEAKLDAGKLEYIGILRHDDLNELPDAHLELQPLFTSGLGENIVKQSKIKPQIFFKKKQFSEIFNKEIVAITLLTHFEAEEESNKLDELKKHTQEHLKMHKKPSVEYVPPVPNIQQFASFSQQIDLHIEILHENPSSLNVAQILEVQLRTFESYMAKALQMGVARVFIIHGLGTGKLRNSIHARLRRSPYIASFRNEYHKKYGYGATEVIFK